MRLTLGQAIARYGAIESGAWPDEDKWCVIFKIPDQIAMTWINSATGSPTIHIYLNRDIAPAIQKALELVVARNLVDQLKTFDGCFMIRDVRGQPGKPSCHSYACALDINAATNRLGTDGDMNDELAGCFIEAGFSWGKRFNRRDPMHFSLAWE